MDKQQAAMNKRGMTLMELLVTMIILVMVTSALAWMLVSAKTIFQSSASRSSNRQDLQVITREIGKELGDSNVTLLTVTGTGVIPAFGFLSAYDRNGNFVTDASGAPSWQKYILYYIPAGTTKLLCKEIYGTFTLALTQSQLLAYCTGDGRVLTPSITALSLTPDTATKTAALVMTLKSTNSHGKIDQQSSKTTILMND